MSHHQFFGYHGPFPGRDTNGPTDFTLKALDGSIGIHRSVLLKRSFAFAPDLNNYPNAYEFVLNEPLVLVKAMVDFFYKSEYELPESYFDNRVTFQVEMMRMGATYGSDALRECALQSCMAYLSHVAPDYDDLLQAAKLLSVTPPDEKVTVIGNRLIETMYKSFDKIMKHAGFVQFFKEDPGWHEELVRYSIYQEKLKAERGNITSGKTFVRHRIA